MERGARVERGTVVVRMMGTKSFCRKVQIGLDERLWLQHHPPFPSLILPEFAH